MKNCNTARERTYIKIRLRLTTSTVFVQKCKYFFPVIKYHIINKCKYRLFVLFSRAAVL